MVFLWEKVQQHHTSSGRAASQHRNANSSSASRGEVRADMLGQCRHGCAPRRRRVFNGGDFSRVLGAKAVKHRVKLSA